MILYLENPKDYTHEVRANKWIQQSSKIQNWHMKISCNEQSIKIIKKTTPFTIFIWISSNEMDETGAHYTEWSKPER